ncbi:hypothetical protein PP1Y_Lpl1375 (plasmid) [Novosphingobium sp. PP1Y]|nr:hypothetical protein PP1Y_Lpl1375 [Novosphingobium sp. PP1Y]
MTRDVEWMKKPRNWPRHGYPPFVLAASDSISSFRLQGILGFSISASRGFWHSAHMSAKELFNPRFKGEIIFSKSLWSPARRQGLQRVSYWSGHSRPESCELVASHQSAA